MSLNNPSCNKVKVDGSPKIHHNDLNAFSGIILEMFTSMKCISTMYRMSGGGPWFFMLVGVVDWRNDVH